MARDFGLTRRTDGTDQVTYEGKPLYLFSAEQYIFVAGGGPSLTAGNGNGLHGPKGGTFSVVNLGP